MNNYCYYSDLPSPLAYMQTKEEKSLSDSDINRIIEMAWEDRTPFDAIEFQFGLNESEVRTLMRTQLKFASYIKWRQRVESCSTKHSFMRNKEIARFKCSRQRDISQNRISKYKK